MDKEELFQGLLNNQRIDILKQDTYDKMTMKEIKKISSKISNDLFKSKECCEFSGKINGIKPVIRFRGKYVNLRRLLYHNYVDNIVKQKKIYMLCKNNKCLNFLHYDIKIN